MTGQDATTRWRAAALTALCVPLGLGAKRVSVDWIADHLAGAVYVMFWCFLALTLFPGARRPSIVVPVVLATCSIELLQLSDAAWLEALRAHPAGGLLLGATFSWADFPFYAGGGITAWVIAAMAMPSSSTRV